MLTATVVSKLLSFMMQPQHHQALLSNLGAMHVTDGNLADNRTLQLSVISFNMHGFNQGSHSVRDLVLSSEPDVFLLQEHWLTPANLFKFAENFPTYQCFGSSAMASCVETGVLYGRPFGGVAILVRNQLRNFCQLVCAAERFMIVTIGNLIIVNVYLPCVGTVDRVVVIEELLTTLLDWVPSVRGRVLLFGGDFNTDLDVVNPVSNLINRFIVDNGLHRCDSLLVNANNRCTYFNESQGSQSAIDYFLASDLRMVSMCEILDLNINLSDHAPVRVNCQCTVANGHGVTDDNVGNDTTSVAHLRWDYADLSLYRECTHYHLQPILTDILELENCADITPENLDWLYGRFVYALQVSSNAAVPSYHKFFFKFWWDQELDELKDRSIDSCKVWKAAGKPRSGPIFNRYRKDKTAYRHGIRSKQQQEKCSYTNDLHEALLKKQGPSFWKCWRSKFECGNRPVTHVNGISDNSTIAEQFACHFSRTCSFNSVSGAAKLKAKYDAMRPHYVGAAIDSSSHSMPSWLNL